MNEKKSVQIACISYRTVQSGRSVPFTVLLVQYVNYFCSNLGKGIKAVKKQVWMTSEIMSLIDKKRRMKDRNNTDYRELNKGINIKCRRAKVAWYEEQGHNIGRLEDRGKTNEVHREIKWLMKQQKKKRSKIMVVEQDKKMLRSQEEVDEAWLEYVKELYGDNTRSAAPPTVDSANVAPAITMPELEVAIKTARRNKALSADGIPAEMLKCLSQKSKEKLLQMLNKMYRTGETFRYHRLYLSQRKGTRGNSQSSGRSV